MKIVYLWRRFSQATKTSNERFQGSPELHFGCKFKIYASEKHLVTKKLQTMRFEKWAKVALGYRQFYKDLPENDFKIFSDFFRHIRKSRVFLKSSLVVVNHRPFKWLRNFSRQRNMQSKSRYIFFKNQ